MQFKIAWRCDKAQAECKEEHIILYTLTHCMYKHHSIGTYTLVHGLKMRNRLTQLSEDSAELLGLPPAGTSQFHSFVPQFLFNEQQSVGTFRKPRRVGPHEPEPLNQHRAVTTCILSMCVRSYPGTAAGNAVEHS